jgi:hypothetical protein
MSSEALRPGYSNNGGPSSSAISLVLVNSKVQKNSVQNSDVITLLCGPIKAELKVCPTGNKDIFFISYSVSLLSYSLNIEIIA